MSMVSLAFLFFIAVLVCAYYMLPKSVSPYVLLIGSVWFYLQFDIKYIFFLLATIITTFFGAIAIENRKSIKSQKVILFAVLFLNIGLLFMVKFTPYIWGIVQNFFDLQEFSIKIIIPIGISFYTLQLCGYCIDVYLKKYPAEINFFKYASFSLFFPIILQGPISRYDQLGKQLFNEKDTNNFYENLTFGTQLILWGFFKKLVIADRCALIVNLVFNNHANYFGLPVLVASILYTLQIYTDFSGCVDISRGVARIFGIDLIDNFRQPYFSTSIQDFWKRWHISLSSWLRDYVYIPLGGNRKGKTRKFFNLIFTFLVSGLWYGVGVHFIIWGLLQAILQIISTLTIGIREKACNILHIDRKRNAYKVFQIAITICLINFSWIFFRADGSMVAVQMVSSIFKDVNLSGLLEITDFTDLIIILLSTLLLFIVSTFKYEGRSVRKMIARCNLPVRWTIWIMLLFIVVIFGVYGPGYSSASFIYMNF